MKRIVTCRICGMQLKSSADGWARIRHWKEHHSDHKSDAMPDIGNDRDFIEYLLKELKCSNPTSQDTAAKKLHQYCCEILSRSSNSTSSHSDSHPDLLARLLRFLDRRSKGSTLQEQIAASEPPTKDHRKKVLRCRKCGLTYENAYEALVHHRKCAAIGVRNNVHNKQPSTTEGSAADTHSVMVCQNDTGSTSIVDGDTHNEELSSSTIAQLSPVSEPTTVDCTEVTSTVPAPSAGSHSPVNQTSPTCQPCDDALIGPVPSSAEVADNLSTPAPLLDNVSADMEQQDVSIARSPTGLSVTVRCEHNTNDGFSSTGDQEVEKLPVANMVVNTKGSNCSQEKAEQECEQHTASPSAAHVENEGSQAGIEEDPCSENMTKTATSTGTCRKRAGSLVQLLTDLNETLQHSDTATASLPNLLPISESVKMHPRHRKSTESVGDSDEKAATDSNLPHAAVDCGSKKKTKHPLKRSRSMTSAGGQKRIKLVKKSMKKTKKVKNVQKLGKKGVKKSASIDFPTTQTELPTTQAEGPPSPFLDTTEPVSKAPSVWDELMWNSTKDPVRSERGISSIESSSTAESDRGVSPKRRRQSARKSCPSKQLGMEDSDDDCILVETVMPIAVNHSAQVMWCPPEPVRIDGIEQLMHDPSHRMVHRKVIRETEDSEPIELEQVAEDLGIRLSTQKKNVTARKSTRGRPQSESSKSLMAAHSNSFECHLCGKIITMQNLDVHWKNECNKGRA